MESDFIIATINGPTSTLVDSMGSDRLIQQLTPPMPYVNYVTSQDTLPVNAFKQEAYASRSNG